MAEPAGPVAVTDADARKVAFGAGTALEWYDFFLFGHRDNPGQGT
jgi:hypothetical protein